MYQGTVLGPPLWNVHFEDVSESVPDGFSESKFADDLNVYKAYPVTVENEQILEELSECQTSIHDWGAKNQVIFDETKEEYAIIGERSKNMYQLGDEVYVKVKNADLVRKHLDFEMLGSKNAIEN